jgi:hypothetical protein
MIIGCDNRDTSRRRAAHIKKSVLYWGIFLFSVVGARMATADIVISNSQPMIDFGSVGMDLKVYSRFYVVNTGSSPVRVKSINVPCSCSSVALADSLIKAGESTMVRLTFDTKNLYGKTIRSFTINTSDSRTPVVEYAYHSLVGQWPFGFKPDPISLIFLPTVQEKRVSIPNVAFESVKVRFLDQADTSYSVAVQNEKIVKGGKAEIVVKVHDRVKAGTYLSSFRALVEPAGGIQPFVVTIPLRIVRY